MRTQLNSENTQVKVNGIFTDMSISKPSRSISPYFSQSKILGILAGNLNAITLSTIGK